MPEDKQLAMLRRRLEREQKARREAEEIAERVTGELYRSAGELKHVNLQLEGANEELQTLNQAMRDFVAVASHDLRGPLTGISGAASTLTRHWERLRIEQRQEFLAMIERQAQHLTLMVEDLLTVSTIEAGALDTRRQVIKLRGALDQVIKNFGDTGLDVRTSTTDFEVLVDPDHLQRILMNYLGNALKYGRPPVEIEACEVGEWIEICVRDNGEGVPEEFVPRLFGKFARGDTARTLGGTGLGLSIVQGLARANGGESWYEPNCPRGSCFGVRLPSVAA